MRVLGSGVNVHLAELRAPQRALGDHAPHGFFQNLARIGCEQRARVSLFHRTWARGCAVVNLRVEFAAREDDFLGVQHDHEVAGVNTGRESGFVFSAQHVRDARRQTANCLTIRVDDEPVALDFKRFGPIGFLCDACHSNT